MKLLAFLAVAFLYSCQQPNTSVENQEGRHHSNRISDTLLQQALIKKISSIRGDTLVKDTAVYLFLPLDASCPACRDKTIDSIIKYAGRLDKNHFVIISAPNMKTIDSYF